MKDEIKEERITYEEFMIMKDEIKEILDKLLKYLKESNINDFGYEQDKLISYEEAQILLDYITNLQEENEKVHKELDYADNYNIYLISKIDKAIENIDLVIELIKQQPTEDDTWILNRLNGFKYLLQGEDNNE